MFNLKADFIGSFKLGDNINHNFSILKLLYKHFDAADVNEKRLLCKPITIILVSIIEAILHDFHERIVRNTNEGVENLNPMVLDYIRHKKIDELERYIVSARKHDFFNVQSLDFYNKLDELRKLRNRIHIQNNKNDFEKDEYEAFNESRKVMAEQVLEKVVRVMVEKYSRGSSKYVTNFEFPWDPYWG